MATARLESEWKQSSWIMSVIANGNRVGTFNSFNSEFAFDFAFKSLAVFIFNGIPASSRFYN